METFTLRVFRDKAARLIPAAIALIAIGHCSAAAPQSAFNKGDYGVNNVVDTTEGFLLFGAMPAVNNAGSVAFTALGTGFLTGAVFKSEHNKIATIASSSDGVFGLIGSAVDINASGTVAFLATLAGSPNGDAIIAAGNGKKTDVVVKAVEQGLFGRFLSVGGINNAGTVVFLGTRLGFASQAIFAGDGGPLSTLIDTKTSTFAALGNADINNSGAIVFRGFLADGTQGLFTGANGSVVIADTRTPMFAAFLEPVINDSGLIGSAAFLNGGGALVFTSKGGKLTPRNNPANPLLLSADNVCINNSGDVAFSGDLPGGDRTIYAETTGGDSLVPVITTGDSLFGSTVAELNLGTHSLNDRGQISFQYRLADGRAGIALAYPVHGSR